MVWGGGVLGMEGGKGSGEMHRVDDACFSMAFGHSGRL